jgi:hypothetical protein
MRKLFSLTILTILLIALFGSCKKDDVPPEPTGLTDTMARDSLYYIMNDWYYWVNEMPDVNKDSYSDPYTLLEAMRYKELDRWSFVADYEEFEAQMAGSFVGHGFRIGLDESLKARIVMIFSGSPLYASGVRRGWIVDKINGVDIAPLLASGNMTAYNNAIGPPEAGVTNTFIFTRPDGSNVTISSAKSSFTLNTVLLYDTLHLTNGVTGHLVFESFIKPSTQELQQAFTFFKQNNITDLILDLRYNSGGYLDIAQALGSYIGGNGLVDKTFGKLEFNDKRSSENFSFSFISTNYSIGLPRMVVITSRSTASASEAVINSLKPFMEIVTVGDTTNGKPTGMLGWDIGKKYWMWPVTFKIVNSLDEGDYFEGFFPDKVAADDITRDFDDRNEVCLGEAISYLETGVFRSAKSSKVFKKYPQISEKPSWMNNTFVKDK